LGLGHYHHGYTRAVYIPVQLLLKFGSSVLIVIVSGPLFLASIMATLSNSFPKQSDSTAVIVPGKAPLTVSFSQLSAEISSFQKKLAILGISRGAAVSIALPNTYEFIV
jgi:hypothetical protein